MQKYLGLIAALSLVVVVSGCQSDVQRKTDMLSAAGFRVQLADSPARAATLQKIPPNRFMMATMKRTGRNVYIYADPAGCNCVYYGGPKAYAAYLRIAEARGMADRELLRATMAQDLAGEWGLWGGPGWQPY